VPLELGLDTFGDVTARADGQPLPQAAVIRNVIEQAVLADGVGVAFIGVGEHHRADFAVSAPETVASRIAATATLLGLSRFNLKYSAGLLAHDKLMRCIEL
jgi:alkanesulfonate monooxygenase SsuD/methylene tetrahydromethanopterin reductase-like flavin-dependent oxidoreductase (luciferase family)